MRKVNCSSCSQPMIAGSSTPGVKTTHICSECREKEEAALREETKYEVYDDDFTPETETKHYRTEIDNRDRTESPYKFISEFVPDWVQQLVRKIEVHVTSGRWDIAVGVLEHYRSKYGPDSAFDPVKEESIGTLCFKPRLELALLEAGITTIGQLLEAPDDWLDSQRHIGPRGLEQIHRVLGELCLERRGTDVG